MLKLYSASPILALSEKNLVFRLMHDRIRLDNLGKGSVEWRTDFNPFVEVDRSSGSFGNAFGCEIEFLQRSCQHTVHVPRQVVFLLTLYISL
jgi:hypothetical protein